jgi:cobalt/nickel transport system permease protein
VDSRASKRRAKKGFVERNITGLAEALDHAAMAEEVARGGGWLQTLDPRTKIIGFGLLIVAVVSARQIAVVLALLLATAGLALASRIPLRLLVNQVWSGVLFFTGLIALPAIFLTPGKPLCLLPVLHWPITAQGLQTAGMLLARAETTATLALTLVLSTRWTHVLKALRVLHVPTVMVVILGMTHRYIFFLLHLAGDFFVARRSRLVGPLDAAQRRQVAASAAGVLLGKSLQLSGEVYQAMQSRGFRGEVHTLDDFRWQVRDGFALTAFFAATALALWFGLD